MNAKLQESEAAWTDPDDAPEITEEWIAEAELYNGDRLVRLGDKTVGTPAIAQPTPVPFATHH